MFTAHTGWDDGTKCAKMLFLDAPYSFVWKLTMMILAGVVQSSTGNAVSKTESPALSRFFVRNVQKWLCAPFVHFLPKWRMCKKDREWRHTVIQTRSIPFLNQISQLFLTF